MPTQQEFQEKFWKALDSDRTMMLGIDGELPPRPMTGLIEHKRGPIWFFTARDNALVSALGAGKRGLATFASKGNDLFATVDGNLTLANDRAVIDRLWNSYVAAWFKGGKDDPELTLLRFDAEHAEIWLDASSIVAGIKIMLGADPRKDYQDKVADVPLR